MTDEEYAQGWRQVRLFTAHKQVDWYPELLAKVVKPFVEENRDVPLFFSRYICPLGSDDGDTNIKDLPDKFRFDRGDGSVWHASVRVRFRESEQQGKGIGRIADKCDWIWYSNIKKYDVKGDMGGGRFATRTGECHRLHRCRLVSSLLLYNCLLVLDSLCQENGKWVLETNSHEQNSYLQSVFQSLEHMMLNVWTRPDGSAFPVGLCLESNQRMFRL